MRQAFYVCVIASFAYLFYSCSGKEDSSELIDPVFQVYVDNFFLEAEKRNVDLSGEVGNFSVQFEDLGGIPANGICRTLSKEVVIHLKRWEAMSERQKERLIFHELGHCLLSRPHLEEVLTNGECRSIMKGAEGENCTTNVISDLWQEYYYDEMFSLDTPEPDWYVNSIDVVEIQTLVDTTVMNASYFYFKPNKEVKNYSLNATFVDWTSNQQIEISWGDFRFLVNDSFTIISYNGEFIYTKRDLLLFDTTELGLIEKEGLFYFIWNGEIFHIMEALDSATDISMQVTNSIGSAKIPLRLEFSEIE